MRTEQKQDQFRTVRHIIYGTTAYPPCKPIRFLESEMTSNLALQKLLYYNVWYSFMYFYMMLCTQVFRVWVMEIELFAILRVIFILLWGAIEIFRLLNGFEGNIKEQFPEIYSFWVLTIMNIIFQTLPLLFDRWWPIEYALIIVMDVFSILELILGFVEMVSSKRAKVALLGQRAPPDNREYLMRKQIEHMRMEQQLGIKHRKRTEEDQQETEEGYGEQKNGYTRLGQ